MPTEDPRLRIAILGTRGIPASYGGFETFAQELSIRLARRGHHVTVYGRSHYVDPALDGTDYEGVRIRLLPTIRHKYLDTVVHASLSCLDCVRRPYDVALMCNAANGIFCVLPRWFAIKVAINVDGIERQRRKWNRLGKAYYRFSEWCSVKVAHAVVADAEVIAAYYRERYGVRPVVIPYGGDLPRADDDATLARWGLRRRAYVLYVSRLEPENNADVVIRAFRGLETDLKLVIVGGVSYRINDVDDLRARLQAVLRDPTLCAEYERRAAARVAQHYTWESVTSRYEALCRTLTGRR